MKRVEVLLAIMHQKDLSIVEKMNITSPIVIANQDGRSETLFTTYNKNNVRLFTTNTIGVGANRNIALLNAKEEYILFSDDDMVYYQGYEDTIIREFNNKNDADIIIFNVDLFKNNIKREDIPSNTDKRLHIYDALKYGTFSIAAKRSAIVRENIWFSTLFGGGALYSCGEDSTFIIDALKHKLRIYSSSKTIGKNNKTGSTWFNGYNEKYYFDKGAWICANLKGRGLFFMLYLVFRLRKNSECGFFRAFSLMRAGAKCFHTLTSYEEYSRDISKI